jgi:protein SCO1/2
MNTKSDGFKLALGILGGIAAIVVFGLLLSFAPEFVRGPQPTPTPGGIVAGEYRDVPDVTLVNQDNQPMKLSALKGKPVLMSFGYTYCPDVCPMTMSDFRRVKRELGDAGDEAHFVFISVDPDRDTPEVVKRYVEAFDPTFVGLTGDAASLQRLSYALDGMFEKQKPNEGDPNSYTVAHTSFVYLFNADGKWKMKYPFGTPVDVLAADLKAQIE